MTDRDIDRDMLTPAFRFLLDLARIQTHVNVPFLIGELRRQYGTKVYNYIYKLAMYRLVYFSNGQVYITEKGLKLANCIKKCITEYNSDSTND